MRITPAYAGKTPRQCYAARISQDHPRLRGKNLFISVRDYISVGSPPLTREKLEHHYLGVRIDGITPAYAGKTGSAKRTLTKY